MGDWVQILQWAVITILGGKGVFDIFLFFKSKKRIETANADKAENDAQSQSIDNKSKCYKAQDDIIQDLLKDFQDMTSKFVELTKNNNKLQIRISDLEVITESNKTKIERLTNERCTVENCTLRQPPRKDIKECTNCKEASNG